MIWKISVAILVILLSGSLFMGFRFKREKDLYKQKVQDDFKRRYVLLEDSLRGSERKRVVLGNRLDSSNRSGQVYFRVNEDLVKEIKKIRGSYEKKTPSELEQLMINRAKR